MSPRKCSTALLGVIGFTLLLPGCGGSGGGATIKSPFIGGSSSAATANGITARFHVDLKSGTVSIANSAAPSSASKVSNPHAVFSGTAISFSSSTLFNLAGNNGTKVLSVSLTNNSGLTIGGTYGLNAILSGFSNVGSFPDVRSQTNVSTLATGFYQPLGVVSAGNGTLYVADTFHNQIKEIQGGTVSVLAGTGAFGETDGPGSSATFGQPIGIALYNGTLIVADWGGNKIRQVSLTGQVKTLAASATFNQPWGIATDGASNIYVSEVGANDIRQISGSTVSVLAGGTGGNQDGVGSSANFLKPEGIAFSNGNLYVADTQNHKVRQVAVSNGATTTIAGTGGYGYLDGVGNVAEFYNVTGVTVLNGAVVVSESEKSGENDLRQITPIQNSAGSTSASWQTSTIAGGSPAGDVDGAGNVAEFFSSNLLSSDTSGNIYVADTLNNAIREVSPNNGIFPIGVPQGGTQNTERVQLANATGQMDSATPGQTFPYVNYPGPISNGQSTTNQSWWFYVPSGVNAFEFNVTIQAATSGPLSPSAGTNSGDPSEIVSTYAGSMSSPGFLDGPANQARFSDSPALVWTPIGIFVADAINRCIDLISPAGQVYTIAGAQSGTFADGTGNVAVFAGPTGLAADSGGNIYVSDGATVRILTFRGSGSITSASNWNVNTIAGNYGGTGVVNGPGNTASFLSTTSVAVDQGGDVFVLDSIANEIRQMIPNGGSVSSATNWTVSTFAGSPIGTSGYQNGSGATALFNAPRQITLDGNGNLYVADGNNNAIRKVTRDATVSTVLGGPGLSAGYTDGLAILAEVRHPVAVVCDSAGYLYFTDQNSETANCMVRRLSPGGVVSTVAGSTALGEIDGPGNQALFHSLTGITMNPSGDIYVSDNSAIRLIQKEISVGSNAKQK